MPDHKETGREPTEREREAVFAPHQSPDNQADGDPGRKTQPRIDHGKTEDQSVGSAGEAQADGDDGPP